MPRRLRFGPNFVPRIIGRAAVANRPSIPRIIPQNVSRNLEALSDFLWDGDALGQVHTGTAINPYAQQQSPPIDFEQMVIVLAVQMCIASPGTSPVRIQYRRQRRGACERCPPRYPTRFFSSESGSRMRTFQVMPRAFSSSVSGTGGLTGIGRHHQRAFLSYDVHQRFDDRRRATFYPAKAAEGTVNLHSVATTQTQARRNPTSISFCVIAFTLPNASWPRPRFCPVRG